MGTYPLAAGSAGGILTVTGFAIPSGMSNPLISVSRDDHEILPPYNSEEVSSVFLHRKSASQPWITLYAKSMHLASSSSQKLPLYKTPGETVHGEIVLLLDKPDLIQAVKITLRGTSSYGSEGPHPDEAPVLNHKHIFYESMQMLWSNSEGHPVHAEPPPWGFPSDGKLQGKYTFSYLFRLPIELPSESMSPSPTYLLPASLYDKNNPAAIKYELIVTLVRGTLKANTSLGMDLMYLPRIKPDPPSMLRQSAYADGTMIVGPLQDPLGWQYAAPRPEVKGKITHGHPVTINCTFALAKPLTYTRGSFIPLSLSIECANLQALDVVQSPAAVSVILLQRIITGKDAHIKKARSGRDVRSTLVSRAVFWPSTPHDAQGDRHRTMMGEIPLGKKLTPTTVSPRLAVEYSVIMFPFRITGFIPADPHAFLVDQSVDIVTHGADGCLARSQRPQGYEDPSPDPAGRLEQVLKVMQKFG